MRLFLVYYMQPAVNTQTNIMLSFMEQLMSTVVPAPHDFIHQGNPAQTLPYIAQKRHKNSDQMTTMILVSASIHAKLSTKLALNMSKYKTTLSFKRKKK